MVKVDIEYCGICNFLPECQELKEFLLQASPNTEVSCYHGRRGSFEVKINDTLVHSKLKTMAFPQPESVLENVRRAERGESLKRVEELPITKCSLM